jgi:hypothetical protein
MELMFPGPLLECIRFGAGKFPGEGPLGKDIFKERVMSL